MLVPCLGPWHRASPQNGPGAASGVGARDVWCVLAADRLVDAHSWRWVPVTELVRLAVALIDGRYMVRLGQWPSLMSGTLDTAAWAAWLLGTFEGGRSKGSYSGVTPPGRRPGALNHACTVY